MITINFTINYKNKKHWTVMGRNPKVDLLLWLAHSFLTMDLRSNGPYFTHEV